MKKFSYKWELILMLWFAFFLNQGDRQVYGAIVEDIQARLGLSGVEAGIVVTVFTIVYGCLAPFGGYIGDFLRRKWIVSGSGPPHPDAFRRRTWPARLQPGWVGCTLQRGA